MLRDEAAQPFHRVLACQGLADVEGNLMLHPLPVVGDRVVHMDRVPQDVGEEADRVFVEGNGRRDGDVAGFLVIAPLPGGHGFPCGAVDDLPPAADVVPACLLYTSAWPLSYEDHGGGQPIPT